MGFYAFSPWHSQTCIMCINNLTRPNLRTILEGDNHSYVAIFGGDQTQKPHLETRSNLSKLACFLNLRPKTFTKNTSWLVPISQRMYRFYLCTELHRLMYYTSMRCRWLSCKRILHKEQLLRLHPSSCNFLNPESRPGKNRFDEFKPI